MENPFSIRLTLNQAIMRRINYKCLPRFPIIPFIHELRTRELHHLDSDKSVSRGLFILVNLLGSWPASLCELRAEFALRAILNFGPYSVVGGGASPRQDGGCHVTRVWLTLNRSREAKNGRAGAGCSTAWLCSPASGRRGCSRGLAFQFRGRTPYPGKRLAFQGSTHTNTFSTWRRRSFNRNNENYVSRSQKEK